MPGKTDCPVFRRNATNGDVMGIGDLLFLLDEDARVDAASRGHCRGIVFPRRIASSVSGRMIGRRPNVGGRAVSDVDDADHESRGYPASCLFDHIRLPFGARSIGVVPDQCGSGEQCGETFQDDAEPIHGSSLPCRRDGFDAWRFQA